jgi:hypothetical protein
METLIILLMKSTKKTMFNVFLITGKNREYFNIDYKSLEQMLRPGNVLLTNKYNKSLTISNNLWTILCNNDMIEYMLYYLSNK